MKPSLTLRRPRATSKSRRWIPSIGILEARQLLATDLGGLAPWALVAATPGVTAQPMFDLQQFGSPTPSSGAFTPSQIRTAYGFDKIKFGSVAGDGAGQTIAIVNAYHNPNMQADLDTFSAQFGLPKTTITQVNQTGTTAYPATDLTGGWELEEALDVEWAHAIAPGAKILLVEANSPSDAALLAAVDYASLHANVVSMSWGGGEFSGEITSSFDGHFSRAGVAFVASSGDSGAPASWPAVSPNVVSVGGTALTLGAGNTYGSESGWNGSGGGPSLYESMPSYQVGVANQVTMRGNPDVAYDASPYTGFAVNDSFGTGSTAANWSVVGGTSAGAPQWAALLAIADQGLALSGQSALNTAGSQQVLTALYKQAGTSSFHDVTSGTSTGSPNYTAAAGYDLVTGIGSPLADLVVQGLTGTMTSPSIDHLALSAPGAATAGISFTLAVTAQASGGTTTDTGYLGTVHFSSSDVQAGLPANYTFTAADQGTHAFTVTLKTAASQSLTVADTANATITATVSAIAVSPAAASQFVLGGLASTAIVGTAQTVTVTARDDYGNLGTSFTGTVHFASTDAAAGLPADYTYTSADKGAHSFALTFYTAGVQSVTVATAGASTSQSGITVSPAAPISLAAKATSTSQITLTWSGASGATGYSVERSANGSTGWTQVATTAAGTTTYGDSGLAAGTIYFYRVRALGGSGTTSAYSNTASGTTAAASVTATTSMLWSNSYTPTVNSYASGAYEVGVKFRSDVAGTVTGARFYKQTWMGGYTHVGHLWTSSGTLLATATFTGESASGWQQVNFSTPVAIAANTTYIVSFSSGGGYFGISSTGFSTAGVDNGPLHAPSNAAAGGNGVYHYGNGTFPSVSGSGMNFWADVAFSPSVSPSVVAPHAATSTFRLTSTSTAVASTPKVVDTSSSRTIPTVLTVGSWPYRRATPATQVLSAPAAKRSFNI